MFIQPYSYTPTFEANTSKLTKNNLQKFIKQGLSDREIADIFDISPQRVAEILKQKGLESLKKSVKINYDEYDFYYLRTLIDEGNSTSQIAKFYKKSLSHIRRVLKHFNLKTQEAVLASAVTKEELSKLISAGKTQQEIAESLFLEDYNTVTHLIKKFKLEPPVAKVDKILPINKIVNLIFEGMTPDEIAQKYNINAKSIKKKMKVSGFYEVYKELYQPHDISPDEIKNFLKNGYTVSELAEMYHVSLYQLVKYMIDKKVLKTDVPVKELVKSIRKGLSINDIALEHEVFKSRVPKILTAKGLKTKSQQTRASIASINIDDIKKIMHTNSKISIDELAQQLGIEGNILEKILEKNNIKIYAPHKIQDYNSINCAYWMAQHIWHGDSPVQLGELVGMSSSRTRKLLEKLSKEYKDTINFPKIPKNKQSPTSKNIIQSIVDASQNYIYPQINPYDYSQIYLAKDFLKVQICKQYNISDTTLEYLLDKYNLNEVYNAYAKKMANR